MWSAAWAWLILTIGVVIYVVVFDVHAYFKHGETMSGQFHDWVFNPTIGPIIFGVWVGLFVALTFHWFQYRGK
jgi:hypothetical protein